MSFRHAEQRAEIRVTFGYLPAWHLSVVYWQHRKTVELMTLAAVPYLALHFRLGLGKLSCVRAHYDPALRQ
jgi:hypothetical protein